jgi:hypothetical protein
MNEQFWFNDPSILLRNYQNIYLTNNMSYSTKLNTITRIVLTLSIIGFLVTFSFRYILIGLITVIVIVIVYESRKRIPKEGMDGGIAPRNKLRRNDIEDAIHKMPANDKQVVLNETEFTDLMKRDFYPPTSKNPFSNVLLTDINDAPKRKPAPPSFNDKIGEDITKMVKKTVQSLNPDITNTNQQLYGDLWDKYELDQSNRLFYSTANTKIVNDQGAYAHFLYGDMPSGKDGSTSDLLANSSRYLLLG